MNIIKKILLNIYNSIRVFLLNLKRNFLREFLVGIGIIFGVSILIIATTFSNGLEKLVKSSVLGQIKYEEIIIKGKKIGGNNERAKITTAELNELREIEGIERAEPMAEIDFPISAIMKIPVINRNTILGLVGNAVPSTLGNEYIKDELKEKFPDGFHKTKFVDKNGNEKYITPVLFSNFIYEAIGTFLEAEGLEGVDLRTFLDQGYQFRLRMGKSMFQSVKSTIDLPNGDKIDSKIFDDFMNDYLNKHNKSLIEFYDVPKEDDKEKIKRHRAMKYSAGSNINDSSQKEELIVQKTYGLDPSKLNENNVKINEEEANPYEAYDYKQLINEPTKRGTYIEHCMFVGSAPVSITFTLSLPLEVVQAYKREFEGDAFQKGYNSVFLKLNEDISSETEYELKKFYNKYHFQEDEKYKTLRGTSKIINDTIKALRILVFGLGVLMLLLSAMAIFYSFMYIITRRAKEIGLYRFFGATRGKVIILLILESAFVGFLCSLLGYLLSYWLINILLPSILNIILMNLPSDILNLLFPPGTELSEGFEFNDIFTFPYDLAFVFMWVGVLISVVSAFIPSIKGSYTSLFKTINS